MNKRPYTVQTLGPAEVEGRKAEGAAVSDAARKLQVRLWIDPATGLLLTDSRRIG